MTNLAIRGHETRGKEVIEILEMLGASNPKRYEGSCDWWYYSIEDNRIIQVYFWNDFSIFTLEEFLEKFPYKVGDKVKYINNIFCIKSLQWDSDNNTVMYYIDADWSAGYVVKADELQPYKEQETMKDNSILNQLIEYFNNTPRDVIEKEWREYDKYNEIGPTVKEYLEYIGKPKYPKTYVECCEVLVGRKPNQNEISFDKMELCLVDLDNTQNIDFQTPQLFPLDSLFRLLMCRNAYWKLAGEQMGLDKPWEPDYTEESWEQGCPSKYVIYFNGTCIVKERKCTPNYILSFPTEEMRDAFFENFEYLIEICKELL